jgi:1-aminocyclopropane-1-carboxylate deaminase
VQELSPALVCGMTLENCRVLRLDRMNPPAGGNKYFKLKENLAGLSAGHRVLSFGGAWSNHIHALAALGWERGFATVGIIRGERPQRLSATLEDALDWGMQLVFVSRSDYRRRYDAGYLQQLRRHFDPCVIVPEGGANPAGVKGCRDIVRLIDSCGLDYDRVAVACGTGSTLAGIACELGEGRRALGIAVLKGQGSMCEDVKRWVAGQDAGPGGNWRIEQGFHCGGYARAPEDLQRFILEFEQVQGIPLDPVYTGKLFYALYQLRRSGGLPVTERIIAVHSGGLQGRRGFDWLEQTPG